MTGSTTVRAVVQITQEKVRETVKEQQSTVRNILDLAPVQSDAEDCRSQFSLQHTLTLLCLQLVHNILPGDC